MRWRRLARFVRVHPIPVLVVSLLLLVPPAAATTKTRLSYNELRALPVSADSVRGYEALAGHFDQGEIAPVVVVVRGRSSLWTDAGFRAINDLTVALSKIPGVSVVRSLTQPTGGMFTAEDLAEAGLGDLLAFPDRLQEGADGAGEIIGGLTLIRDGLREMGDRLPELRRGLAAGADGTVAMRGGIRQMRDGVRRMRDGLDEAAEALDQAGAGNDLADLAAGAATDSKTAFDDLYHDALPTSQADPAVQDAIIRTGRAYAQLTGRDPIDPSKPASDPSNPGRDDDIKRLYDAGGVEGSLRRIASGLREAVDGLRRIDAGLVQIDDGLAELGPGLRRASAGVADAVAGIEQMVGGLDRIIPGLQRLRAGLAEGAARFRSAGFGNIETAGNLGLTPALVDSVPGLAEQLGFFVDDDRRTTRLFVTLENEPYHPDSLDAVTEIERTGPQSLNDTPLEGLPVLVGGAASFFDDIRVLSKADMPIIIAAVLLGILFVLILLLRSIIAPLYLIATVVLSLLATLGLTTLVFQGLLGHPGVSWWLPPFLFVMLVALGADYNIFLMSRIREESKRRTTADATAVGLAATGHVITSAGLILAGTFAALMLAPLRSMQQFGFAVSVGVLLDTFVVRSLMVPSIAILLGRHNWWPSRRAWAK
ncbi:MAG TPA: MMPL family transporter [Actinomycetota bacterium]